MSLASRRDVRHVVSVIAGLCLFACTNEEPTNDASARNEGVASTATIYVVNYPLEYFARRIGGEGLDIEFPVPPDIDPAFWMPDADNIGLYQRADVILLNGAGYAGWTRRVSLPSSKLVDTSASFSDRFLPVTDAVTHAHGPGGEHKHTGTAFTTWIDFSQAAMQARAVRDALAAVAPERAAEFGRNYEGLRGDILELDADVAALTEGRSDLPLLASHPVYDYFARRYGLNMKSVLWEPDEMPDETSWARLVALCEEHAATWMIWESEPLPATVERLEQLGIRSVVFDPCGNRPSGGDFVSVMKENVEALKGVFE